MHNNELMTKFSELSTPLIADAMVRSGIKLRFAPTGIRALVAGTRLAGRIIPVSILEVWMSSLRR